MAKCEKCVDTGWEWLDTSWGSKTVPCSNGCPDIKQKNIRRNNMDSKIYMEEEVENKSRKFGSNLSYIPCHIVTKSGDKIEALFTHDQLETAIERAQSNPEDMPEEYSGLFGWLFG